MHVHVCTCSCVRVSVCTHLYFPNLTPGIWWESHTELLLFPGGLKERGHLHRSLSPSVGNFKKADTGLTWVSQPGQGGPWDPAVFAGREGETLLLEGWCSVATTRWAAGALSPPPAEGPQLCPPSSARGSLHHPEHTPLGASAPHAPHQCKGERSRSISLAPNTSALTTGQVPRRPKA